MMNVESILEQVGTLPPLPSTSVRLMNVIADPKATLEEIVEVIKYDQALTVRVLKLCNSSYFGLSRQVTSLNEAMIRLGTVKILQMVMSIHTGAILSKEQEGYDLSQGMLWRHSVAVALGSAAFAKRLGLPNTSLSFTAGLLHDIGKVVLSKYVADEFTEIIRRVMEENKAFSTAEREVLGYDHTQIGAMIAEQWQLPEAIVHCIRYHHNPEGFNPPDALVDTVYLSNCVCLLMGIGLGTDGLSYVADSAVAERHGMGEQDLEKIGLQIVSELHNLPEIGGENADANEAGGTNGKRPVGR